MSDTHTEQHEDVLRHHLAFLEMAGQGCISGNVLDWPQLKPACAWAAAALRANPMQHTEALRILAAFAQTAPGRLPERVQRAVALASLKGPGAVVGEECVRCTCEWASEEHGSIGLLYPYVLDSDCAVHGAPNDFAPGREYERVYAAPPAQAVPGERERALESGVRDLFEKFRQEALRLAFNTHGPLDGVQRCNLRTYNAIAAELEKILSHV